MSASSRPFYVTTPIYYVNSVPHVGTAYSTIAADVFARYARVRGRPARFLTGLDEHGLKIARLAAAENLAPQAFVDRAEGPFRRAWEVLGCEYDDFIRTTEARHTTHVQELWKRVAAAGDIYLGHYEDWYCVDCEAYYTEKDLLPGNVCPTHKKPVEKIREQSYFFKLSAYTDKLLAYYDAHPNFVRPEGRYNEVKAFVREGLRDLSISRTSFRWGIPVPGDTEHVMYVWFDALTNYISALGGPPVEGSDATRFETFWPHADESGAEAVNLVGKDILRFHTVFWPAFLLSAGLAPPTHVQVHGFLTVNGEKISKSLGNAIAPEPLVEAFGADVLRYYLMRDVGFGHDGDFSHTNLLARYHGDLGNGLGNLLNRMVASIVKKSFDGRVPHMHLEALQQVDRDLIATAERSAEATSRHLDAMLPNRALESAWELVIATNKYIDLNEPWNLAKNGEEKRLAQVAYTVLESLRWLSVMLWPVMPRKCNELRTQLGLPGLLPTVGVDLWPSAWGGLTSGTLTAPGAPLFPRYDDDQQRALLERLGVAEAEAAQPSKSTQFRKSEKNVSEPKIESKVEAAVDAGPAVAGAEKPASAALATIDDLSKIELRLALVLSAERVPKSDKLLRLQVEIGEPAPRQILAGIGKVYEPEALVGRRIVVVANLAPRKMMGLESRGMVLAAGDGETLSVLSVDKDLAPGSIVK
jgi:methionyl-tRNA synthetase